METSIFICCDLLETLSVASYIDRSRVASYSRSAIIRLMKLPPCYAIFYIAQ